MAYKTREERAAAQARKVEAQQAEYRRAARAFLASSYAKDEEGLQEFVGSRYGGTAEHRREQKNGTDTEWWAIMTGGVRDAVNETRGTRGLLDDGVAYDLFKGK